MKTLCEFEKKYSAFWELFSFLGYSQTACRLLNLFLPQYQGGRILIEPMTSELIRQFKDSRQLAAMPASAFWYDGKTPIIFLQSHLPIGVGAMFLIHEVSHATDAEYLGSFRRADRLIRRAHRTLEPAHVRHAEVYDQLRLFKSEKKAYDFQFKVAHEIAKSHPLFQRHLDSEQERLKCPLQGDVTDREIALNYNINLNYLKLAA